MSVKRYLFVGIGLSLLVPSIAGASGAAGSGCASWQIAVGLAFLPPEAITDYARDRLLGDSDDGG